MEKIVGESWREDWARVGGGGGGRPNGQTGSDLTAPQHSLLPSLAPIRSQPGHSIAALIAWWGGGGPIPEGLGGLRRRGKSTRSGFELRLARRRRVCSVPETEPGGTPQPTFFPATTQLVTTTSTV